MRGDDRRMPRPPIQAKSKNEQVYDYLHERIIRCEIAPGSRLVVDHLARELGVSQIPIREAIFRLEADGFVRTQPHVGATVTELHAGTVREVFDSRNHRNSGLQSSCSQNARSERIEYRAISSCASSNRSGAQSRADPCSSTVPPVTSR